MKIAVIGSRTLAVEGLEKYLPAGVDELISGGAKGIDRCVRDYARMHGIKITEFLPNYKRYGKGAPHKRNDEIIRYADAVVALWDGKSKGTEYVINACRKSGKDITVYIL